MDGGARGHRLVVAYRSASPDERAQLDVILESSSIARGARARGWRGLLIRVVPGVLLLVLGLSILSRVGGIWGAAVPALVGGAMLLGGLLVLLAPWWLQNMRDLSSERRARVRVEERNALAAHVHDSVLQTLTLIERAAPDNADVIRLARSQERDCATGSSTPTRLGADPTVETLASHARRRSSATSSATTACASSSSSSATVAADDAIARPGRRRARGVRQRRQVVGRRHGHRVRRGRGVARRALRARHRHRLRPRRGRRRPPRASPCRSATAWPRYGGGSTIRTSPGRGHRGRALVLPRRRGVSVRASSSSTTTRCSARGSAPSCAAPSRSSARPTRSTRRAR